MGRERLLSGEGRSQGDQFRHLGVVGCAGTCLIHTLCCSTVHCMILEERVGLHFLVDQGQQNKQEFQDISCLLWDSEDDIDELARQRG